MLGLVWGSADTSHPGQTTVRPGRLGWWLPSSRCRCSCRAGGHRTALIHLQNPPASLVPSAFAESLGFLPHFRHFSWQDRRFPWLWEEEQAGGALRWAETAGDGGALPSRPARWRARTPTQPCQERLPAPLPSPPPSRSRQARVPCGCHRPGPMSCAPAAAAAPSTQGPPRPPRTLGGSGHTHPQGHPRLSEQSFPSACTVNKSPAHLEGVPLPAPTGTRPGSTPETTRWQLGLLAPRHGRAAPRVLSPSPTQGQARPSSDSIQKDGLFLGPLIRRGKQIAFTREHICCSQSSSYPPLLLCTEKADFSSAAEGRYGISPALGGTKLRQDDRTRGTSQTAAPRTRAARL